MAPFLEGWIREVKRLMQMFVYEMTCDGRRGPGGLLVGPFPGVPTLWRTNLRLPWQGLGWRAGAARTYGEFEQEVRLLFKALMEVMLEGDYWKPFSFPKPGSASNPISSRTRVQPEHRSPDLP